MPNEYQCQDDLYLLQKAVNWSSLAGLVSDLPSIWGYIIKLRWEPPTLVSNLLGWEVPWNMKRASNYLTRKCPRKVREAWPKNIWGESLGGGGEEEGGIDPKRRWVYERCLCQSHLLTSWTSTKVESSIEKGYLGDQVPLTGAPGRWWDIKEVRTIGRKLDN